MSIAQLAILDVLRGLVADDGHYQDTCCDHEQSEVAGHALPTPEWCGFVATPKPISRQVDNGIEITFT
jgi:hypothetical protein